MFSGFGSTVFLQTNIPFVEKQEKKYDVHVLAGQDASTIFETTHHSAEAREMMQAFYVGQYVEVSNTKCWDPGKMGGVSQRQI